tara:strand:+ start:29 stop:253 length:225 start_codon:yes stop_codon:yes gene_type:complete
VPNSNKIGVKKMKLLIPNNTGIVNIEDAQAFLEFVKKMQKIIKIKLVLKKILILDLFKARAIDNGNKKVNQEPA